MNQWTRKIEAERLAARFEGLNQAEFARKNQISGGASLINQHIKGKRPISLSAANAYARAFGVSLEEISPRWADTIKDTTFLVAVDPRAAADGDDALSGIATLLLAVPEEERDSVSRKLAAFALAPDSVALRRSLLAALKPIGAPIAAEHVAELEQLSREAEQQHGEPAKKQRLRASRG